MLCVLLCKTNNTFKILKISAILIYLIKDIHLEYCQIIAYLQLNLLEVI